MMIAFIQEDDASTWLRRINGWLADMGKGDPFWAGEQLKAVLPGVRAGAVHRFRSCHRRARGSGDVELWHLWIVMAVGSTKRRGRPGRVGDKQIRLPFMNGVSPARTLNGEARGCSAAPCTIRAGEA